MHLIYDPYLTASQTAQLLRFINIVNLFYFLLCFFADYCNFSCEWRKTDSKNPNFLIPVVLYTADFVHMLTEKL